MGSISVILNNIAKEEELYAYNSFMSSCPTDELKVAYTGYLNSQIIKEINDAKVRLEQKRILDVYKASVVASPTTSKKKLYIKNQAKDIRSKLLASGGINAELNSLLRTI